MEVTDPAAWLGEIVKNPFRYFKTSPAIVQLGLIMYVRIPLSLRNVEDLLRQRGIGLFHESVRTCVDRFTHTSGQGN